jgi:hypothetical protein
MATHYGRIVPGMPAAIPPIVRGNGRDTACIGEDNVVKEAL